MTRNIQSEHYLEKANYYHQLADMKWVKTCSDTEKGNFHTF